MRVPDTTATEDGIVLAHDRDVFFAFSNFLNIDPITMAYSLKSPAQEHLTTLGMSDSLLWSSRTQRGGQAPQLCLGFWRRKLGSFRFQQA